MEMRALPEFLASPDGLTKLTQLLLEKDALRRSLKVRDFGPRVTDAGKAQRLLSRVVGLTEAALGLDESPESMPKLALTTRLTKLPRQVFILYLLFLPVSLLPFFLSLSPAQPEGSGALWVVRGSSLALLAIPLLVYRRTRLNIEHQCGYVRDRQGRAVIVIDQLPTIQFESYLAHEYAHHLYLERFRAEDPQWKREGWARLVQWQVVNHLCELEGDPAYLCHALAQIIGELKFACRLISTTLHRKLPRQVERIRSVYRPNPVWQLLTGTPGFSMIRLMDHAVGTAACFLQAERIGVQRVLGNPWSEKAVQDQALVTI